MASVVTINWALFLVHVLVATALLIFTITWAYWLWFLVCRPARWEAWVKREHAAMKALGLPDRVSRVMYSWQVGWPMRVIVAVTILFSLVVLHLI
jgi:hypothetical protein